MSTAEVEYGHLTVSPAIGESASTAAGVASAPVAAAAAARDLSRKRRRTSPAQTCFSDGLHSIFAFLTLREFSVASRCCRHWSVAASSQPLRLSRDAFPTSLQAIADSPIARHIYQLRITTCGPQDVSSVLSLCCRLPHLAHLDLGVNVPRPAHEAHFDSEDDEATLKDLTPQQMPTTLRKLQVILSVHSFRNVDWSLIDPLLVPLLHSGTPPVTSLQIQIQNAARLHTQIPVETLKRLLFLKDSLTELTLSYRDAHFVGEPVTERPSGRWTKAHIDVFRQLTRLEKLNPFHGWWSDEELIMLCAEPAPAHLHLLPLNAPPRTPAGGDALARLPLTEFDFWNRADVDFSFLRRMPTLQSIRVSFRDSHSPAEVDVLVDILAGCTQLTQLELWARTTNAHLCRLLPSLTNLRSLTIGLHHGMVPPNSGFRFGSLSFASAVPHLARTLEHLKFAIMAQEEPVPLSELRHLLALRNLRHLGVFLPVEPATPRADLLRVRGELNTERPKTFQRDRWPHMVEATVKLSVQARVELSILPHEEEEEHEYEDAMSPRDRFAESDRIDWSDSDCNDLTDQYA